MNRPLGRRAVPLPILRAASRLRGSLHVDAKSLHTGSAPILNRVAKTDTQLSPTGKQLAVVYASVHHGNTRRIAEALATELSADLFDVDDVTDALPEYDLVGLGSGIYFGRHHRSIRQLVSSWNDPPKRVFIFSTAGLPSLRFLQHSSLRRALRRKGCEIVGEFCCRGWDTVGPLWLLGGINRKRPNDQDLRRACQFAAELKSRQAFPVEPRLRSNGTQPDENG